MDGRLNKEASTIHKEVNIMSEEQELEQMRNNLLESLRPFCADPEAMVQHLERRWAERDEQETDFTPIQEVFVRHARISEDRKHDRMDQNFCEVLNVEAEETKRRIRNARSIGNLPNVAGLGDLWQ